MDGDKMYKHCTTEESVSRQRQIEHCLLELMHSFPYPQITIVQICQRAGVSRKCFYRYFGSKDDCLFGLIDHCIMDGASYYLPNHNEIPYVRGIYERFFSYWKYMEPLLNVLDGNNLSLHLVDRMLEYLNTEERNFHQYLGGNIGESYEKMLFLVSGIMGLVLNWHRSGYAKSVSQMAAIMESVLPN